MATSKRKTAAAAADAGLPAYRVLGNIDHNGTRYSAGELLHLDDEDAAPLLAAGMVEPAVPRA